MLSLNRFLLVFLYFWASTVTSAQPVYVIDTQKEQYNDLNTCLYVMKDPGGTLTLEQIRAEEYKQAFTLYNRNLLDEKMAVYWTRIKVLNNLYSYGHLQNWILVLGQGSYMDVYVVSEDGTLLSHDITGQFVPASKKRLKTGLRKERVYLSLPDSDTVTIYLRSQVLSGLSPDFHYILSPRDFTETVAFSTKRHRDGLFIGFLVTLMLINLLFYYPTLDKAFLYQALFLAGQGMFMLHLTDIICEIPFFNENPTLIEPAVYLIVLITNIAYLHFLKEYMGLKDLFPNWNNILTWLAWVNLAVIIGSIIIYLVTLNEVQIGNFVAGLVLLHYSLLTIFMYDLYRTRDTKAYFLVAATLVLIACAILMAIRLNLGYRLNMNVIQLFIGVHVLLFFLGLAYRVKQLRFEEKKVRRLQDLDEIKTRIYTNITHEFRTPLTVIKGLTEQIEKLPKLRGDSEIQNTLQVIKRNGENMLQLVNRLLEMAKLESGRTEVNLQQGDIIEFLSFLTKTFYPFAETKKIALSFKSEISGLNTSFDQQKLQQIITNLVANALKYTNERGSISIFIKIRASGKGDYLSIIIEDTGIGISKEELPFVFDRFYQSGRLKLSGEGTGIGLSLTKELVTLVGGSINVISTLGEGSIFTLNFPITREELKGAKHGELCWGIIKDSEPSVDTPTGRDLPKEDLPLLLIVEDNPDIIFYLRSLLNQQYEIESANNGRKGLEKAIELIPDVIISDVMMPEMDGFELCERIKTDFRTDHIPVILLTAKTTDSDRLSGLKHGADVYLTKPFQQEELNTHLKNLVELRRKLHEYYSGIFQAKINEDEIKPIEDVFLKKVRNLLDEKLRDENFSASELSEAMNMSRSQLHRKITALTNNSTTSFIRSYRLQKAKVLLKKNQQSISEVAYETGFRSPSYFTNCFVEEFGMSPSEFRNNVDEH